MSTPAQALTNVAGPVLARELVFADLRPLEDDTAVLVGLLDPAFLAGAGWDRTCWVLRPPPGHRLLGRSVCRAAGCAVSAPRKSGVCAGCARRLAAAGLSVDEVGLLKVRERRDHDVAGCQVPGCARQWVSGPAQLCRTHLDQREGLGLSLAQFLTHPAVMALAANEPCQVAACPRQRRHHDGRYCEAHQIRLRMLRRRGELGDEEKWARTEPAIGVGGQVSLRGLPDLVVAQVLLGLQRRCQVDAVRTKEAVLKAVCDDLRRQQVTSISHYQLHATRSVEFAALATALARHARRALTNPATEAAGDVWDLAIFGHFGTLTFTDLSQPWLRELAKRWALDDLPRRVMRPGRRTSGGLAVRHHIGALARLSQSLRMRPDGGADPSMLGRVDIEAFLNRLAYLAASGVISTDARIRAVREVRHVLASARAAGLTRPGAAAAGLGQDFLITTADVPDKPEAARAGRDLPPDIMRQICAHLHELTSATMRAAIELAIDTGRRPEEICDLAFGCLAHEADGSPVLVFDNHKAGRLGRRLPISANTAAVISTQQHRVRARYPDTAVGDLKLLPTDRRNPDGSRAITAFSLAFHHRAWIQRMPPLRTVEGIEFDKARVVLYAYRHTYAQRHADAGVPIDVLRELMDHRKLDTTSGYYCVGESRRREAVDRVAAMAFDRHGQRIWRQTQQLLDSEHARRGIGEVAVPFGLCAEPSNVQAGGTACPYRFRCVGCDHFRTDVSYLPDLHAHLEDLLRNREKLLATGDLEDWARDQAMPCDQEVTAIRRLIAKIETGLEELTPQDRDQIEEAVQLIRRHRTVTLGMPRVRQPLPDIRPTPGASS